ncbi:hypothetical protein J7447_07895 [Labrenzia sp. R5_0]|nr:hypothetical protein [Labrenzia sp. R5_0]
MPVKPILFSGPMVQALLAGRKTQTRRVINTKGGPNNIFSGAWTDDYIRAPGNAAWRAKQIPFAVGDLLWVREGWCHFPENAPDGMGEVVYYRADNGNDSRTSKEVMQKNGVAWQPSIFMPRWASRLTLKVTNVRSQRVQEICEPDAKAEGVEPIDRQKDEKLSHAHRIDLAGTLSHALAFEQLWDSLNEERGFGWDVNPWVAAYTFEVHHCNVDEFDRGAA